MANARTETVRTRVRPSAKAALEEVARSKDITTSEAVREALAEWVARHRKMS